MINFKQYINESNIDKIKEECKKLNPDIDYSKDNWEKEFIDNTDWDNTSHNKKLSEKFIEYFKNYINWDYISQKQDLSESFIEKHKDKINWYWISCYQKLSESFIEKYKDNVDWEWISCKQNLSELFIERNKDKIDFEYLFYNRNITNEFIFNHINWFIDEDIKDYSWRFNNKEFSDKWNKYKKLFGV